MASLKKSTIFKELLEHIEKQRIRAKLVDRPFELGVVTDTKPSLVLSAIQDNLTELEVAGMKKYCWQDDALRSQKSLAGEDLLISICGAL